MNNSEQSAEAAAQQSDAAEVTTSSQTIANAPVVGSLVKPHDRFKNAALFLCGYLKYPEEKVDEVASIIRCYADLKEPYELCTCKKCKTQVELQFYEGDEDECSYEHFYCPKCRANYYDKKGEESWKELDSHYEDIEERFRERQFENTDDELDDVAYMNEAYDRLFSKDDELSF